MTAIEIYKAQYELESGGFETFCTKYDWAASRIFDLVTYDPSLDEYFVKTILEVCKVILEKRNYDYIRNKDQYLIYILVCQMLDNFNWINWGTSIRGAWFEATHHIIESKDILEDLEWGDSDGWHKIEHVPFTVDNLRALIEFMEE
jgi:hypothetical protein